MYFFFCRTHSPQRVSILRFEWSNPEAFEVAYLRDIPFSAFKRIRESIQSDMFIYFVWSFSSHFACFVSFQPLWVAVVRVCGNQTGSGSSEGARRVSHKTKTTSTGLKFEESRKSLVISYCRVHLEYLVFFFLFLLHHPACIVMSCWSLPIGPVENRSRVLRCYSFILVGLLIRLVSRHKRRTRNCRFESAKSCATNNRWGRWKHRQTDRQESHEDYRV